MTRLKLKVRRMAMLSVVFSLVTADLPNKDAYASESARQSNHSLIGCPCVYDEPFATVMSQIKNDPEDWQFSPPELHKNNNSGNWDSYRIFKLDQKRHTLQLKLTRQAGSALLFCSWIQWSNDGSIYNQIGMGHHLYKNAGDAEAAQENCVSQLSSRLPVKAWYEYSEQKIIQTIASGI